MRKTILSCFVLALSLVIMAGCAPEWQSAPLADFAGDGAAVSADACRQCHQREHEAWSNTGHADGNRMQAVSVPEFSQCGACHAGLAAHLDDPSARKPPSLPGLSKTEQNETCGKCHFNREVLGDDAMNPLVRHGLFTSVGFQGQERQLSCLECHEVHGGRADMLRSIRAHTCFGCHKEAIITMGVFQPFNYLGAGKVCLGCHPAHGGSTAHQALRMTGGVVVLCVVCHV